MFVSPNVCKNRGGLCVLPHVLARIRFVHAPSVKAAWDWVKFPRAALFLEFRKNPQNSKTKAIGIMPQSGQWIDFPSVNSTNLFRLQKLHRCNDYVQEEGIAKISISKHALYINDSLKVD